MQEELVKLNNNEIVDYYSKFVKLDFPENETMSTTSITKYIKNDIAQMYLYKVDNNIAGWTFLTIDKVRNLICLHYLAIFKEYRNKGYGSKILNLLKTILKNYNYMYLDVEAVESGNLTQIKRHNFYIKNGFIKTRLETIGWKVHYNYFCTPLKTKKFSSDEIFDSLMYTYLIKNKKEYLVANFKRTK